MYLICVALQIVITGSGPETILAQNDANFACTASSGLWTHASDDDLETEPVASLDPYSFSIGASTMGESYSRRGISAVLIDELVDTPVYIIESESSLFQMSIMQNGDDDIGIVRREIARSRGLRYSLSADDQTAGIHLQWYVDDGVFNLVQTSYEAGQSVISTLTVFGTCEPAPE